MTYQPYDQQPAYPGPPPPQQHQYPPHQMNGYGYPPLPPPPAPKKNRTPLYATIFVLILVVGFFTATGLLSSIREKKEAAYEETLRTGTVGTAVRDGDLSFTVTKVERKDRLGGKYINKDAQGEFVVIHLRVLNLGKKPASFTSTSQKLVDASGRQFEALASAALYAKDPGTSLLYERIGPGNHVEGVVVFDVPKGTAGATLELHDSTFSKGAKVNLG